MSRTPDIINVSVDTTDAIRTLPICINMRVVVRYWIGRAYRERIVIASTLIDRYVFSDSLEVQAEVFRGLLNNIAGEIRKEDERLQNIHTPKPVRKVSPRKEEAGELGGYGTAVPDILWGTVDAISTKPYPTGIGSVEGSPTLYVSSALNEGYDDGRTGVSTGQRGRIQL